jgi:DNA polymerase-3 subunit delta
MIIFLYGQDNYSSRQKLKEIISHYKKIHKNELNLKYLDLEKDSYQNFRDELQSLSIFAGRKLIVLERAISNEDFKTNFLKDGKKFLNSNDIVLFYEDREISEKDRLFKFLKKQGKAQEFKPLEGQSLRNWARKEFANYQVKIRPEALEKLINFVGNNLWQLSNEIEKLINYKKAETIETKDIELLIQPKIETEIFKTIDAIAAKNKRKALSLIHQHLEKGDSPLYLLSMINLQFRNLLLVKSYEFKHGLSADYIRILNKKLGMHPFVARKTMELARKFSLPELKKIYHKIFYFDLVTKTGRIDGKTALDLLITDI